MDYEVRHDAMECQAVVIPRARELHESADGQRSHAIHEADRDHLSALQLDAGWPRFSDGQRRRARQWLRIHFLRLARPLLNQPGGRARHLDVVIAKEWRERTRLIGIAKLAQPIQQRQPGISRRVFPFSCDPQDRIHQPVRQLRRRLRAFQLVGRRLQQLVIGFLEGVDEIDFRFVTFEPAERCQRRFTHVVLAVVRETFEGRSFIGEGGRARGVHPDLPRRVLNVAAEERNEHPPRADPRQPDECVRGEMPLDLGRRARLDGQAIHRVHIVLAPFRKRVDRREDDRGARIFERVVHALTAVHSRFLPGPGSDGLDADDRCAIAEEHRQQLGAFRRRNGCTGAAEYERRKPSQLDEDRVGFRGRGGRRNAQGLGVHPPRPHQGDHRGHTRLRRVLAATVDDDAAQIVDCVSARRRKLRLKAKEGFDTTGHIR